MRFFLLNCFLFVCLLANAQSIVYVTEAGRGNGSGTSWANALPGTLLASRLPTAAAGTQFWIAAGTYKPTTTLDRSASFSIASGISLYGGFAGIETTLASRQITYPSSTSLSGDVGDIGNNTDNSYHLITLNNVSAKTLLDNLVITGGNSSDEPVTSANARGIKGAIINVNSYALFTNCQITKNNTLTPLGRGGGMVNDRSSPTLINCTFSENFSYLGGGICNINSSQPIITNCLFTSNSATQGGIGAAIYSENDSRVSLTNCTMARNVDTYSSGPLVSTASTINCIICESINSRSTTPPDPLSSQNCVLWSDRKVGELPTDRLFVNAPGNNFRLLAGSPAVDAGYPAAGLPVLDLDGKPRFRGDRVDIGAYEFYCEGNGCLPIMVRRRL